MLVRIACIAWLQTGHYGKIDNLTLKERPHYLIKICAFLFAFAVSEERNTFGQILLKFYHTDTKIMIFVPHECHLCLLADPFRRTTHVNFHIFPEVKIIIGY